MAEKKFEKGKEKKGLMMPGKKIEHPGKLFVRLMKYVLKNYTFSSVVVVVCIIVSVLANVQGTMFIRSLIDDFIEPMLKTSKTDFGPLAHKILQIACFYLIGVAASYIYNRVMVRERFVTCEMICSIRWNCFQSVISIRIPMVILCLCIQMILIHCVR